MTPALFHESLSDALRELVAALGGSQSVGVMLRPEKPADDAGAWVKDCLNPSRRERFTPEQVLLLLRKGREIGCHAAANHFMREAGYADPVPVEPEDEKALLEREFIAAAKSLQSMAERLQRIGVRVAA